MTQHNTPFEPMLAPEGSYLTQTAAVDIRERIIATQIHLAATDNPANYRVITAEEADAYRTDLAAAHIDDEVAAAAAATYGRERDNTAQ